MPRKAAIIGVGQTYHKSKREDVSIPELCNEAVRKALEDAQIKIKDIDAVITGNMELFEGRYQQDMWLVDHIGAYGKPGMKITTGGTTGGTIACAAFEYVASGAFDLVLAVSFEKQYEGDSRAALKTVADPIWNRWQTTGAIGTFARHARSYMKETAAPEEIGALVRLRSDRNACRNPYAHLRLGLKSVEEVLKSSYLVPPLRTLDMCPASEGACVLIVASEERALRAPKMPVWAKDWITVHKEPIYARGGKLDLTDLEKAASTLFKRNGITKPMEEISVAELYCPSTWSELGWLEAYGFCEKGEAWRLEERGYFNLEEGKFPVNPSGGVVATNPIGATALIRVAEVALQLRGDAGEHQIPREPTLGFSTAWGGSGWTVAHLLSRKKN